VFIHSQESSAKAALTDGFDGPVALAQQQLGATPLTQLRLLGILGILASGIEAYSHI
jgi:hypothetical protein